MKVIGRYALLFVLIVAFFGIGKISFDYLGYSRAKETSRNVINSAGKSSHKVAELPKNQKVVNKEIAAKETPVTTILPKPNHSVLIPAEKATTTKEHKAPLNAYVRKKSNASKSKVSNKKAIASSNGIVRDVIREKKNVKRRADDSGNKYLPYLQVGGTRFFNGQSSVAAGIDLFVPILQSPNKLVFTDVRFYDRTGKSFEGNIHLGYRQLLEKENLYGVYGAFDRKRSEFGNYFNQMTFGAEFWHKNLFVGGNFYQPVGSKSKLTNLSQSAELDRVFNNIWITTNKQYEKAMAGGDIEVGYEFVKGLIGYVGGYYFQAKDTNTICGPKARLSYDYYLENGKRILEIFDKLGLETGVQRDLPRGTTWYLSVNFRVGLLPNKHANLQGVARHMVDLVRRDVDIVSKETTAEKERKVFERDGKIVLLVDRKPDVEDRRFYYEVVGRDRDYYEFVSDGHKLNIKIDPHAIKKHVKENVEFNSASMIVGGGALKINDPDPGTNSDKGVEVKKGSAAAALAVERERVAAAAVERERAEREAVAATALA
ncbi:MAG TPA: hypothetical protein DCZ38_04255, partial [Coxiellaceae bacterium]|nr:hypothetical protein [Coxiellaceae bacterium]